MNRRIRCHMMKMGALGETHVSLFIYVHIPYGFRKTPNISRTQISKYLGLKAKAGESPFKICQILLKDPQDPKNDHGNEDPLASTGQQAPKSGAKSVKPGW